MKPKILVCTEFTQLATGYSVYGKDLISGLINRGFEVAEMGIFCNPEDPRVQNVPWPIYATEPPHSQKEELSSFRANPNNAFGGPFFEAILLDWQPTHVIVYNDPWMMEYQRKSPYRDFYSWCIMPAVDAIPQQQEWIDMYRNANAVLGYCDWGLDVLKEFGGGKINTMGVAAPCPLGYSRLNKTELKASLGLGSDISIVGTVMRNQTRKLFPELMECFSKFLRESGRNDIYLYCHTGYPDLGWNLPEFILNHGLSSKVILTYQCQSCKCVESSFYRGIATNCQSCGNVMTIANSSTPISTEQLNRIYNMFDLYVQYSGLEGFGIPQVEAAMCGIPIVATDYSAMSDVVRKVSGYPIELSGKYVEMTTSRHIAVPNNEKLISVLKDFFSKNIEQRELVSNLTEMSAKSNYNIDKIVDAWTEAILKTKPKLTWNNPPRLHNLPNDFPKECSNSDFVRFLIVDVLGKPELLGSYLESKTLSELNNGAMIVQGVQTVPINRESHFNHFRRMAERDLMLEKRRCGIE